MRVMKWAVVLLCCGGGMHAEAQTRDEGRGTVKISAKDSAGPQSLDLSQIATQIRERTNAFRQEQKLDTLAASDALRETAQDFADYMAETDTYGHLADGQRPAERAEEHGYDYCIVAENIAHAYSSLGYQASQLTEKFVGGWKRSPEHRENMLDDAVTELGVGVSYSENSGHYYAVQLFGRPSSAAIEFTIANESGFLAAYTIDGRKLTLPPRFTRSHMQCRPQPIEFLLTPAEEDKEDEVPLLSGDLPAEKSKPRSAAAEAAKPTPPAGPTRIFKPQHGDAFVIRAEGKQLTVQHREATP